MWNVIVREATQNVGFKILILIQLIIVFLAISFFDAAVVSRIRDYQNFSGFLNEKSGILMQTSMPITEQDTGFFVTESKEYFQSLLKGVQTVGAEYQIPVYIGEYESIEKVSEENLAVNVIMYDDCVEYKPPLEKGRYAADTLPKDGIPEVVISDTGGKIKCGELISFLPVFSPDGTKSIQARVVGVLKEGAKIYGYDYDDAPTNDVQELYYKTSVSDSIILLSNKTQMAVIKADYYVAGNILITFENGISQKEYNQNMKLIQESGVGESMISYETIRENSKQNLYRQMLSAVPALIGTFVLCVVSIISIVTYSILTKRKQIAIYFMCGFTTKKLIAVYGCEYAILNIICMLVSLSLILGYNYVTGESIFISIWRFVGAAAVIAIQIICIALVTKISSAKVSLIDNLAGR